MSRLYPRCARITIARPSGEEFFTPLAAATRLLGVSANAIEISQLRFQFTVEKTLKQEPNRADVAITNLAPGTRAELSRLPLLLRLEAGYDGVFEELISGDVRFARSAPTADASWETKIQVAEGDGAYRNARVNLSYGPGTTVARMLRDLAKSVGAEPPREALGSAELNRQVATGEVLSGAARHEFTRLLEPHGFQWSVQGGRLVILRVDQAAADEALLISADTGMEGSPQWSPPSTSDASAPPTLQINMRMRGGVLPGKRAQVVSKAATGLFKITKVRHVADTHGDAFNTQAEATPL